MKKIQILLAAAPLMFMSCGEAIEKEINQMESTIDEVVTTVTNDTLVAKAYMVATSDSDVSGEVTFTEINGTVTMEVDFEGVKPAGLHAMHIHQKADCSSPDGKSAGGHWNPEGHKHGEWEEGMHHKGDIGNLTATDDFKVTYKMSTDNWCIGCEDSTKNIIGKGLILHAGIDDMKSQPSGNAGARIGCGEIEMAQE